MVVGCSTGVVKEGTDGRLGCEARDEFEDESEWRFDCDSSESWGSSERKGKGHWRNLPIFFFLERKMVVESVSFLQLSMRVENMNTSSL